MIDTRLIPKPKNKKRFIKKNGNTQDIIDSIINVDKTYNHKELQKFSQQFNDESGLKRLWKFIRYEIEYKRDDFDKSLHLTPPALWKKRQGDCKSKTLFVNAVLRCLKIPYKIRFTNYSKNEDHVKHVYTVAIIDDKELPIDTVYNYFGKEKKYNKKIDYNMANIYEISGLGATKNCTSQYDIKPNAFINQKAQEDVQKKLIEIEQRKKEIPEQEPIAFSQISEGNAILKLAKREIELIQAYKPQRKDECRIALNLINKALKGDYSCTGNIPNSLSGLVNKIKGAEKFSTIRANDFGYNKLRDIQIDKLRKKCKHNVNAFPERYCLEKDLFLNMGYLAGGIEYSRMHQDLLAGKITNFNQYIDYLSKQSQPQQQSGTDNYGFCISSTLISQGITSTFDLPASSTLNTMFWFQPQGQPFNGSYQDFVNYLSNQNLVQSGDYYQAGNYIGKLLRQGDNAVFKYGYQSDYHQNFADRKLYFDDAMSRLQQAGLIHGVQPNDYGRYSVWFNNQADYQQAVKELNASSGVIDAFLNDSFNNEDSLGSALFYLFCQTSNININDFPPSVLSKLGVQNQYADATEYFSSVSQSTIYGLARNNILYSNGAEQPESTLEYLQGLYSGSGSINEPVSATVTAIIAAVITIAGIIADAVVRAEQTKAQSSVIDQTASDTANFGNLGMSNVLNENDWTPASGTPPPPSGGAGSGDNTMMLLGAGALAFALLGGKDKKKKKK